MSSTNEPEPAHPSTPNLPPGAPEKGPSAWLGVAGVALALGSQYLIRAGSVTAGLIGFGIAGLICWWGLRKALPAGPELSSAADSPDPSLSLGQASARMLVALASRASAVTGSAAENPNSATPVRLSHAPPKRRPAGAWLFLSHWRQYTIADLLARRTPQAVEAVYQALAADSEPAPGSVNTTYSDTSTSRVASHEREAQDKAYEGLPPGKPSASKSPTTQAMPPAGEAGDPAVRHLHPRITKVSPQGDVIVLISAKGILLRFSETGQALGQIELGPLPKDLAPDDVTLSPDGQKVYIFDSQSNNLRVLKLI